MKFKQDELNVLRKLNLNPKYSVLELTKLDLVQGNLTTVAALKNKGLIKVKNFKRNKDKLGYLFINPKGTEKTKLTINL